LLVLARRARKNSTSGYDEHATASLRCLIDAIFDVCRNHDAVLTRAMWTTTTTVARPLPLHRK
jgi:hypothetical protein